MIRGGIRKIMEKLGSHGGLMLMAMALVVGGAWGFIELADEVVEGDTRSFDEWAVRAMRHADDPASPIGPAWLHEVGRDMTALGGIAVLTLVTAAVAGYLILVRKYRGLILVLVATFGALILSTVLKQAFDRQRPDLVPHLSIVQTASFPSGHSMMSSAVYLTLGTLLARLVPRMVLKAYFIALALLISFLIGISRVYMGVHYPTDVLAGWTLGLVWALLCWIVAYYLQRRGAVEKTDEPTTDLAGQSNETTLDTTEPL